MNPLDIVITAILGFCLIRGIFRGLIKEVSGIIGVLAGFYIAYSYYPELAHFLGRWMAEPAYKNILSFLLIFCAVFVVVSLVGVLIRFVLRIAFLGWLDRISGMLFGLLKGVLISAVILLALTAFLRPGTPLLRDSRLAPYVMTISREMVRVVSPAMRHAFEKQLDELKKAWQGQTSPVSGTQGGQAVQ